MSGITFSGFVALACLVGVAYSATIGAVTGTALLFCAAWYFASAHREEIEARLEIELHNTGANP